MNNTSAAIIDFIGTKGGHHYYSLCLLDALETKGIKTYYFSNLKRFKSSKTTCVPVFKQGIKRNLRGFIILLSGVIKSLRASKKAAVKTQIHHVFEASLINCLVIGLIKSFGFKVVVIVHDVHSFDFKEKSVLKQIQYNWLADFLIVHNNYSKKCLQEAIKKPHKPIHIIPHGGHHTIIKRIDKDTACKALNLNSERINFLFFGQIKKTKGLDLLLQSWPSNNNSHLIIAGKSWRDSFSSYQNIIEKRRISDQIHLNIKYISDEERDLYYSAADFVVLPYREIFQSGVLLMAMSYGKGVIASDLPSNREVIQHNKNGLLFKSGSIPDLRQTLNKAIEIDPKRLGYMAQKTIKKNYDWHKIADAYLSLIKE